MTTEVTAMETGPSEFRYRVTGEGAGLYRARPSRAKPGWWALDRWGSDKWTHLEAWSTLDSLGQYLANGGGADWDEPAPEIDPESIVDRYWCPIKKEWLITVSAR